MIVDKNKLRETKHISANHTEKYIRKWKSLTKKRKYKLCIIYSRIRCSRMDWKGGKLFYYYILQKMNKSFCMFQKQ